METRESLYHTIASSDLLDCPSNYSHQLHIDFDADLTPTEKQEMLDEIHQAIHQKKITKPIGRNRDELMDVWIQWHSVDESHQQYVTNVCGLLGDMAVKFHTQRLFEDLGYMDLCLLFITKPLSKNVCLKQKYINTCFANV